MQVTGKQLFEDIELLKFLAVLKQRNLHWDLVLANLKLERMFIACQRLLVFPPQFLFEYTERNNNVKNRKQKTLKND